MRSHKLGFSSSWKMLTRDKGWIKPLLVLTIVGWIPVLGQIALLGYGLEWARLTAWGVDSAPKQSNVKYGKVLRTGAIALLVAMTMAVVLSLLNVLIFGAAMPASAFPALSGVAAQGDAFAMLYSGRSIGLYLILLVVNLLFGTFISVAMMRATIYDSFGAGWRLDRIFQMIGRDVSGFFQVYLVSLIAGVVNWLYSVAVSFLALLVALGGVVGFAYMAPSLANGNSAELMDAVVYALLQMGPAPVLAIVLIGIALAFAGGVIGTAMELVTINAVGQWFCRFEVGRWGVSGDPLPDGVPATSHDDATSHGGSAASPVQPDAVADASAPATADAERAVPAKPAPSAAVSPDAAATAEPDGSAEAPSPVKPDGASVPAAPVNGGDPTSPSDPAEAGRDSETPVSAASPAGAAETVVVDDGDAMGPLIGVQKKASDGPTPDDAEAVPPAPSDSSQTKDGEHGPDASKPSALAEAGVANPPEKDDHGPWDEILRPDEFKAGKDERES